MNFKDTYFSGFYTYLKAFYSWTLFVDEDRLLDIRDNYEVDY